MANISGTSGADNITGTNDADDIRSKPGSWIGGSFVSLASDNASDTVRGRGGGDYIKTYGGDDIIYGDSGRDTIYAGRNNDHIYGGSENDWLYGERGNDSFYYLNGEDTTGQTGREIIDGGRGWDTVILKITDPANMQDSIFDLRDTNFFSIDEFKYESIPSYTGSITVRIDAFSLPYLAERDGNEFRYFHLTGRENLPDILELYMGNTKRANISGWNELYWSGWEFDLDKIFIYGDADAEDITGSFYDDTIYGNEGNDTLNGRGGDDRIYGGPGDDVMEGGNGDDIFYFQNGEDPGTAEVIDGGNGVDAMSFEFSSSSSDNVFDMASTTIRSIEKIYLFGAAGEVILSKGHVASALPSDLMIANTTPQPKTITIHTASTTNLYSVIDLSEWTFQGWGQQHKVNIIGSRHDQTFITSMATDIISGGGGADHFIARGGTDILQGGTGNDTIQPLPAVDFAGAEFRGGNDHDTLRLFEEGWYHLRGVDFASMEEIRFVNGGRLDVDASEIGNGLRQNLTVDFENNQTGIASINIFMGRATSLDISGWQFNNWDQLIYIDGDSSGEVIIGSSKADIIFAHGRRDHIEGGGGNDWLEGGSGNDTVLGGPGDDIISIRNAADVGRGELLDGGSGIDTLRINGQVNDIIDLTGTALASLEKLRFDAGVTLVLNARAIDSGLAPNLHVKAYNIEGHTEKIKIEMGGVTNLSIQDWTFESWDKQPGEVIEIVGDSDNETIYGSAVNDIIYGWGGNDVIQGYWGSDDISGGDGHDTLRGGADDYADSLWGGIGNDTIWGGGGNDQIGGGDDNDTIYGQTGDDTIWGGSGVDTISGGTGDDTIRGGDDSDDISGNADNDVLRGGGDDSVDSLWGGSGDDTLYGGGGNDQLGGGDNNDTIYGQTGADTIWGGAGNDTIEGGYDDDTIYGGSGNDWIWGGAGVDTFVFRNGYETDVIEDFESGVDSIDLSSWGLTLTQVEALASQTAQGHLEIDFSAHSSTADVLRIKNATWADVSGDIIV